MADSPRQSDVIPMFPGRPPLQPSLAAGALRDPAFQAVRFVSPAVVVALGAFLVLQTIVGVAATLGWNRAPGVGFAAKLAVWICVGMVGAALARRGISIAGDRWR